MARRAFVFGSNGPSGSLRPLSFAKTDAIHFSAALKSPRCRFEVFSPSNTHDPFRLRRELFSFAEQCLQDDVVIIYFSGHGIIVAGALVLVLDGTDIEKIMTTALPCSDIMAALSTSKSQNKLLVLDCCNAGTIAKAAGLKDGVGIPVAELGVESENHQVLMASGHLEAAREIKRLRGSFLTKSICDGVSLKFGEADWDKDGAISLLDLKRWLEACAIRHNRKYPRETVPVPQQFGRGKGDFFLTIPPVWRPSRFDWPDGSTMVALQHVTASGRVTCIADFPVTNAQYKEFVRKTGWREPASSDSRRAFRPWRDNRYSGDEQPVVCVAYKDAVAYCQWVDRLAGTTSHRLRTRLPTRQVWDLASLGAEYPTWNPAEWRAEPRWPRSKRRAPQPISSLSRRNARGLLPMLGNIWEWCAVEGGLFNWDKVSLDLRDWEYPGEIRGGSYREDLNAVSELKLAFDQFPDGIHARHDDLGFRLSTELSPSLFSAEDRTMLSLVATPRRRTAKKIKKPAKKKSAKKWKPLQKK